MFFKKVDQFDNDFPENDVDKIYDKSFKKIEEKAGMPTKIKFMIFLVLLLREREDK